MASSAKTIDFKRFQEQEYVYRSLRNCESEQDHGLLGSSHWQAVRIHHLSDSDDGISKANSVNWYQGRTEAASDAVSAKINPLLFPNL